MDEYYKFKTKIYNPTLCLAVNDSSVADAAEVIITGCADTSANLFKIIPVIGQPGFYRIIAKHSGKCLDISAASWEDNAKLQQYPCHGGSNQIFKIEQISNDPEYYRIAAKHSNKYLEITMVNTVVQKSLSECEEQKFSIIPVLA
jgi:hypothetical protein